MASSTGLDDKAIIRLFGVVIYHKIFGSENGLYFFINIIDSDYHSFINKVGSRKDIGKYFGIVQVSIFILTFSQTIIRSFTSTQIAQTFGSDSSRMNV